MPPRRRFPILAVAGLLLCLPTIFLWWRSSHGIVDRWSPPFGSVMIYSSQGNLCLRHVVLQVPIDHLLPFIRRNFVIGDFRTEWLDEPRGVHPIGAVTAWSIAVRDWFVLIVLLLPAARYAWLTWRDYRKHRQDQRQGLCPHCGYDLRATPHRCPECGAIFAASGNAR